MPRRRRSPWPRDREVWGNCRLSGDRTFPRLPEPAIGHSPHLFRGVSGSERLLNVRDGSPEGEIDPRHVTIGILWARSTSRLANSPPIWTEDCFGAVRRGNVPKSSHPIHLSFLCYECANEQWVTGPHGSVGQSVASESEQNSLFMRTCLSGPPPIRVPLCCGRQTCESSDVRPSFDAGVMSDSSRR
jgi:hypothetical protein